MKTHFRIPKTMLIAAAVVALMTGAATQARAQGVTPDLHYVSVGVSKMPLAGPKHQLPYPHKDAEDLAKVWEAQKGKLYQNVGGEVLTNETAKGSDILAALDRLVTRGKSGDTAVVSLAGHGGFDKILNQWIFVPSDHDPKNFDNTVLTQTQILARLSQLTARGVTVILVLDTCEAGAFNSDNTGVIILAGCSATQTGRDDHRIQNGLFTSALIEALNGRADANGDGVVAFDEVQAYIAQRVPELCSLYPVFINGNRHEQTPICHFPVGLQISKPLAGAGISTQQPGLNPNRVR